MQASKCFWLILRMSKHVREEDGCSWCRVAHGSSQIWSVETVLPTRQCGETNPKPYTTEEQSDKDGRQGSAIYAKAMEQMNIKLSTVLSDITGLSGRRIITAILQGQRNIYELAALAEPNCKASQEDIALSLEGTWDVDLLFMLKQSLAAYDFSCRRLVSATWKSSDFFPCMVRKLRQVVQNWLGANEKQTFKECSKDGYRELCLSVVGSKCIWDSRFERYCSHASDRWTGTWLCWQIRVSRKFSSWCNLTPNNKISGGKILSSKIMKRKILSVKFSHRCCSIS